MKYKSSRDFVICQQTIIFFSKWKKEDEARSERMPRRIADKVKKFPAVALMKNNDTSDVI